MPHSTPLYGISRLQRRSQQRPDSFCREIATFIHKRCLPGFDPELAYGLRLSAWPDRVEDAKTLPGFANGYFHFLGPITFCGTDGLLPETTTCHPAILRRKIDSIAIHANFQIRSHHKGPREPIGARPYRLLKPLANQRVENKMLRKFNKFVNLLYCFSSAGKLPPSPPGKRWLKIGYATSPPRLATIDRNWPIPDQLDTHSLRYSLPSCSHGLSNQSEKRRSRAP